MKHLSIRIPADGGDPVIDVSGFRGEGCLKATAPIEEALGSVKERRKKGEAFLKEVQRTGAGGRE